MSKSKLEVNVIDTTLLKEILSETNPEKLHQKANEEIKRNLVELDKLQKLIDEGLEVEGLENVFILLLTASAFLEARAAYLAVQELKLKTKQS